MINKEEFINKTAPFCKDVDFFSKARTLDKDKTSKDQINCVRLFSK
jgi:hypothetical protein